MENTVATVAGKIAAGTPNGHKAQQGRVIALAPTGTGARWCDVPASDRHLAFAFDAGGSDLIAELEGRCARTRRPLNG